MPLTVNQVLTFFLRETQLVIQSPMVTLQRAHQGDPGPHPASYSDPALYPVYKSDSCTHPALQDGPDLHPALKGDLAQPLN